MTNGLEWATEPQNNYFDRDFRATLGKSVFREGRFGEIHGDLL